MTYLTAFWMFSVQLASHVTWEHNNVYINTNSLVHSKILIPLPYCRVEQPSTCVLRGEWGQDKF